MAMLEKNWRLNLRTCGKNGDISSVRSDVLHKLRPDAPRSRRHALAVEINLAVQSLLRDPKILLNQEVYNTSYLILLECCQATDSFDDPTQMCDFLGSLFNSIKAFLKQNMIKEVLNLKQYIVHIKEKENQCSEKNSGIFRNICALYLQEIATPLRVKYDKDCTDKSYLSLIDVLDDCIDLMMCGGIYNLVHTVSNIHPISKLNSADASVKSRARLMNHLIRLIHSAEICRYNSCELLPNSSEICRQYLFLIYLHVNHSITKDDAKNATEALLKLDLVISFFEPNWKLLNCVKFYKHFIIAVISLVMNNTSETEENFELSFEALSKVSQCSDMDEVTFKVIFNICDIASNLLRQAFVKVSQKSCEEWNRGMNVGLLASMHKVVLEMENVIDANGHSDCKANDGTLCPLKSNAKYSVYLMVNVSQTVLISVRHDLKDIQKLLPQAVIVQKTCFEHVKRLKALGCIQWTNHWIKAARVSFNLGYYCKKSDMRNHQNSFFADLCDAFIELEDLSNPTVTSFSLWQGLTHLFDGYKQVRKYQRALVTLVLALAAVPNKKADIFNHWLTIRKDKLSTKLSDVSLWKIYNKEKSTLHSKYSLDFEKNIVKDEITVLEFEVLRTTAPEDNLFDIEKAISMVDQQLNHDLALTSRALLALLKTTWTNFDTPNKTVMTRAKAVLEKMPKRFKRKEVDVIIIVSELAFWVFLCQLKADRSRQKAEIERGKENRIPMFLGDLKSDDMDVVPAYFNLDVENEMSMLSTLAVAVEICRMILDVVCKEPYDHKHLKRGCAQLKNILEIAAHSYEAYGYEWPAIDCWALLHRLAAFTADQPTTLLALGHLLTVVDHNSSTDLVRSGDALANTLAADAASQTREILISYHLHKSTGCLNNGRYTEGKAALKTALGLLQSLPSKEWLVHVHAIFLTCRYQLLPAGLLDVTDLSDNNPHLNILIALTTIKKISRISIANCELRVTKARLFDSLGQNGRMMKLLFSVVLWYAELCIRQGSAREFSLSVPSVLISVQRQAFALRSAHILAVLAGMDLLCEKLDCQVKINGMENITLLRKSVGCARVQKKTQQEMINSPTFSKLLVVRNIPIASSDVLSSPIFQPTPFIAPDFISHEDGCICIYCKNPEIQTVALDIACLQARFFALHGTKAQALEFFKGAMRIYKHLFVKQTASFNSLAKKLSNSLKLPLQIKMDMGSWKVSLFRIKMHTELSFIDFHVQNSLMDKTLEMNQSLAASLMTFPTISSFLLPEVIHQEFRIRLLMENKMPVPCRVLSRSPGNGKGKSVGQAVASTPFFSAKTASAQPAIRPLRIFVDRSTEIRPQVPLFDLKSPQPPLPANANKRDSKLSTDKKPVKSSSEILKDSVGACSSANSSIDFVELSPEIIPTTQKKRRPGTGLTIKSKLGLATEKKKLETIKIERVLSVPASHCLVNPTVSDELASPIMPEARKKLEFLTLDEFVVPSGPKGQDLKVKPTTETEAVVRPLKTFKAAASRVKARPEPVDNLDAPKFAFLKSKKPNLPPDHRQNRHRQADNEQSDKIDILQCSDETKTTVIKASKSRVPRKVNMLASTSDSYDAENINLTNKTASCVKIKAEEKNETQKLTKTGSKPKEVKVKLENEKLLKTNVAKDLDGNAKNLKLKGDMHLAVKANKTRASVKANKLVDPGNGLKSGTQDSNTRATCVQQLTGMLQTIKLEEEDEDNQITRRKRAVKATVQSTKSKIKTTSDCAIATTFKSNVDDFVRSPLKACLQNVETVNSPVKTRRGRKVL